MVDGNAAPGAQTAGFLRTLGYDAQVAATGAEGFTLAAGSADVELILTEPNFVNDSWTLTDLLGNLKADGRTAGIPVVIVGPLASRTQIAASLESFPGARFAVTPTETNLFGGQLEPDHPLARRRAPVPPERTDYAKRSAGLLATIARRPGSPFEPDLTAATPALGTAINSPVAPDDAATVLGDIPGQTAQRLLADAVLDTSRAARAASPRPTNLARSIRRFGRGGRPRAGDPPGRRTRHRDRPHPARRPRRRHRRPPPHPRRLRLPPPDLPLPPRADPADAIAGCRSATGPTIRAQSADALPKPARIRPRRRKDKDRPMPILPPDRPPDRFGDDSLPGVIGTSGAIREVARTTRQVAPARACVLIVGETGAGKELIARAVHDLSPRQSGPYIRVNCGALTESLLESELFGHVKGSFTGAVDNRTGRFEAAHTGSIFLDEINSTSPKLQVKLLRVLQEGEFERVGDVRTNKVDTRIIAATNRDLLDEIDAGRFREDLYYRLNVVPIYLPPLRERREDIPILVEFFLKRYSEQNRREVRRVHPEAMRLLRDHDWPGNIRELQNYVERAVVLGEGTELLPDHLPPQLRGEAPPRPIRARGGDLQGLTTELVRQGIRAAGPQANDLHDRVVGLVERELIQQVLAACERVQIKAAARLGINRNTLHKKLADYRIDDTPPAGAPAPPLDDD